MTRYIPPALKGTITAILMIGLVLYIYFNEAKVNPNLQYLIYVIYAAGVIWTMLTYRRSVLFTGTFGGLFGQGFRCFIIVTIIMVAFTAIFSLTHPEFADKEAKAYREILLKEKSFTPVEIEQEVESRKKQYTLVLVYGSIIGYLIIGAGVTALGSALLTRRIK